jgi:hypothetical protein
MMRRQLAKSIGAGALVAALAACGSGGSSSPPAAAVQTQPGGPPVSLSVGAVLPQGFPSDFPTYSGARVKGAATLAAEQFTVSWNTTDPADRVIAFYREGLARGDWQTDWQTVTDPSVTGTSVAIVAFTRKSKPQYGGAVTIAREQGATEIAVVMGKGITGGAP